MTNQDFCNMQSALGLSGKELADKLGVHPTAIYKWRLNRPVPDYIEKAMETLLQSVEITVPLDLLMKCGDVAAEQGMTFGQLLLKSLRNTIAAAEPAPANVTPMPASKPYVMDPDAEPAGHAMIADAPDPDA